MKRPVRSTCFDEPRRRYLDISHHVPSSVGLASRPSSSSTSTSGATVPRQDAGDASSEAHDTGPLEVLQHPAGLPTTGRSRRFIAPLRRIRWSSIARRRSQGPSRCSLSPLPLYPSRRHLEPPPHCSDATVHLRPLEGPIALAARAAETMRLTRMSSQALPDSTCCPRVSAHPPLRALCLSNAAESIATARALLNVGPPAADPQKRPDVAPDTRVWLPAHAPLVALA